MKNKIIVSSILTIALCLSMIAGSTFALFTSEDSVNIAVTSGKIEVVATSTDLEMGSTFGEHLGNAKLDVVNNIQTVIISNFAPGDYVTFDINVENKSNVAINYRTVLSVTEETDTALFEALEVYVGDQTTAYNGNAYKSKWTSLVASAPIEKVTVKVLFPDAEDNNDFMGKSCTITYIIEAVQGNTVPVESYNELLNNYYYQDGNYTFEENIETDNPICFAENTTNVVNLQGDLTTKSTNMPALMSQSGSDLTINADNDTVIDCTSIGSQFAVYAGSNGVATLNGGTYKFGETTSTASIYSQNSATVVINDGVYISEDSNSPILYCINGFIEINGGFFENTADKTPDLLGIGTNKDNTNRIVITGGTFVNYNPLEDKMTYTGAWPEAGEAGFGGPWMLIPGGYTVVSETQANGDVWYSVVPVQQ